MKQIVTEAIVLSRTDYGEADRVINFLTPQHGKVGAIAKGVRKGRSKLAGGIELFSISNISFISGKSELKTLTSTQLKKHFGKIVTQIERTNAGYDFLKTVKQTTGDHPGPEYFELLDKSLQSLNDLDNVIEKTQLWFYARLLWIEGRAPNLAFDSAGQALKAESVYSFNFEAMAFESNQQGTFNAAHIKLLRLAMSKSPKMLDKVVAEDARIIRTLQLLKTINSFGS